VRTAPAITVVAAASRPWVALVRALAIVSVLAAAAWVGSHLATDSWPQAVVRCLPLLVAVGLAAAALRTAGMGAGTQLRWDGQAWSLRPAGAAESDAVPTLPRVVADFGAWLLVRCGSLQGQGGFARQVVMRRRVHWLALQRNGDSPRWHGLRCALYATPGGTATSKGPADATAAQPGMLGG
jgi:hypothetical protein